jgi:hypothetical protein
MHRPDQWGYLQFSRDAVNTTNIISDPLWWTQQALMQIYYAQNTWYSSPEGSGQYSTNLTQLSLPHLANVSCQGVTAVPVITVGYHTWAASIKTYDRFGQECTHHIDHDRLTRVVYPANGMVTYIYTYIHIYA